MLGNHLTSFLKNCSLIFFIISCSNSQTSKIKSCKNLEQENVDSRAIVTSTKLQTNGFKNCLINYIKFLDEKKIELNTCQHIRVTSAGRVSQVSVIGINKQLPKSLSMCMTQELWQLDFSSLQLSTSYTIKFPMSFIIK